VNAPPNWPLLRAEFPALANWTYLNTATYGQTPMRSLAAMEAHFERRARLACSDFLDWFDDVDDVRRRIGRLLNCSGQDIAFASSAAAALSLFLGGIEWRAGDRIVTLRDEFPNQYYYAKWLGARGVELVEMARINELPLRTRAVVASTVSYITGYRPDMAAVGAMARQCGARFYVDATQSAGALAIDLEQISPDMCAVDPYKWLLAPNGAAFFYVSPALRERLAPQVFGWRSDRNWRSVEDLSADSPNLPDSAERYEGGMLNFPSIYALGESVGLILETGIDHIERRVLGLANATADILESLGAVAAHRNTHIISAKWENGAAARIYDFLRERRVLVSARRGGLRVSPHFYNDESDLEILQTALADAL
jgi:selenocysteine lyase/cysteine desulfurase